MWETSAVRRAAMIESLIPRDRYERSTSAGSAPNFSARTTSASRGGGVDYARALEPVVYTNILDHCCGLGVWFPAAGCCSTPHAGVELSGTALIALPR